MSAKQKARLAFDTLEAREVPAVLTAPRAIYPIPDPPTRLAAPVEHRAILLPALMPMVGITTQVPSRIGACPSDPFSGLWVG